MHEHRQSYLKPDGCESDTIDHWHHVLLVDPGVHRENAIPHERRQVARQQFPHAVAGITVHKSISHSHRCFCVTQNNRATFLRGLPVGIAGCDH